MKINHLITLTMALALVLSCTDKSQKDSPAVSGLDNDSPKPNLKPR